MPRQLKIPGGILAGISVFIAALSVTVLPGRAAKQPLTPELVTQGSQVVAPSITRIVWRPGHDEVSYVRDDSGEGLWLYDAASGKTRHLDIPASANPGTYQWSPDGNSILFEGADDLWIFNVQTGETKRLTNDSQKEEEPTFSPAGDAIAFVRQNNIYTLSLQTDKTTQLTRDGSEWVYNGILDWVYKEELADRATGRSYEWSPDGKEIAYLKLDDLHVPKYPMINFLARHVELTIQRFPQSGDPNPKASFHVVPAEGGLIRTWESRNSTSPVEYFGPRFSWTLDSKSVSFLTLNRDQTEEVMHLWNVESGADRTVLEEHDKYWINSLNPPHFLSGGRFLWLSERDGWMHLYLYDLNGKLLNKVTSGDWMIDRPLFSDLPMFQLAGGSGWVYFLSTAADARQRQIYRVRLDGTGLERISKLSGTHVFHLSPDGRYYVDKFSDFQTPPMTRLYGSDGKEVAMLDNPVNHLRDYELGGTDFVTLETSDRNHLYARLVMPPDFDPHKKYPVIVKVYGGPEVQMVTNSWGVTSLEDQLFAEHGYLLWILDNRGSWGRGHAWESAIFEHMGQQELKDQLAGIDYLKSLPYVDSSRMGIWGWSYGGYMTLYTLTHAPDVFKCGAAGGPVTDWKFYDSIYTERYMRTPDVNPDGYQQSSPLEAAGNLTANLLLMHGVDDDNVHLQNTINFIEALVRDGKPYQLYLQPGEKHGFSAYSARLYLLKRLLKFFDENLHPAGE
ncbi:MAG TPA: DPP IV N-terminal domain-containing protein [Terriglobia bacterium]|nr:DPP IV N-terminal domain-containing protein [Terriglobia bacterium]